MQIMNVLQTSVKNYYQTLYYIYFTLYYIYTDEKSFRSISSAANKSV